MIRRTFDVVEVNELINDAGVRKDLGGSGQLDASGLLADHRNICLLGDGGAALFAWRGPRIFEGHSFFQAKGAEAIRLGTLILEAMRPFADMVWGLTPEHLRHVRWFNRRIGFSSEGIIETPEGPRELFVMRF
jgi:hypothetical protein